MSRTAKKINQHYLKKMRKLFSKEREVHETKQELSEGNVRTA